MRQPRFVTAGLILAPIGTVDAGQRAAWKLVIESLRRDRPPFRLLSTWPAPPSGGRD
jgi:hypothetical protein